jgi:hypothetical protein
MNFINIFKNSIIAKIAEILVISVIAWISSKIIPKFWPSITAISSETLAPVLIGSIAINIILVAILFISNKEEDLKLKYGIYWDKNKNPFCPNCKIPIGAYDEYYMDDTGYRCKSCEKIFPLTNAKGEQITPEQAIKEL